MIELNIKGLIKAYTYAKKHNPTGEPHKKWPCPIDYGERPAQ